MGARAALAFASPAAFSALIDISVVTVNIAHIIYHCPLMSLLPSSLLPQPSSWLLPLTLAAPLFSSICAIVISTAVAAILQLAIRII